jgi:hypothetical protein
MIEMNPYYARPSRVGPVFDVASFSVARAVVTGVFGLGLTAMVGVAVVYVWNPSLLSRPPDWFADTHQEVQELWKRYPRGTPIGLGVGALVTLVFLAASIAFLRSALVNDYYVRAGAGGLSLRVPYSFAVQELDVAWEDIVQLTVIQKKQLGALARHAGNLDALLRLELRGGDKHEVDLDHFRQPGYLIYDRLQEARQMRPAVLALSGPVRDPAHGGPEED